MYRKQGSRQSPRKRHAKKKAKWLSEEAWQTAVKSKKQSRKGNTYPFECRVPKNSKER